MGVIDKVSPLAPAQLPDPAAMAGVRLATAATAARYKGRSDLLLGILDRGTAVAGVFTQSKTAAAPVDWCRDRLGAGSARALIVNAGNANAFTGKAGARAVKAIASRVAGEVGCKAGEVFVASTGVIGVALDPEPIGRHLDGLAANAGADNWQNAARAIMTTDTYPKLATASARLRGGEVTVTGFAKGSGMIAPDMATMLAFVFTDAALPAPVLQSLLAAGVERSFNAITVDGDTSTNDTVLLFATGKATPGRQPGAPITEASDRRLRDFRRGLDAVLLDLALQVVRDGEGAQKLIRIEVTGAQDARAARRIGLAIGNSPLVKTAIAGEDANWGRIVMAVGKSGEAADRDRLAIRIGGVSVARSGMVDPAYREGALDGHMKGREIGIEVDVGVGRGRATVWTCDLTHGYVDINADYRS